MKRCGSTVIKCTWPKCAVALLCLLIYVVLSLQPGYLHLPSLFSNGTILFVHVASSSSSSNININKLINNSIIQPTSFDPLALSMAYRWRNRSTMLPPKIDVVNPHNFRYVIKPKVTCSDHVVELMIAVPVSRANFDGRKTIRETWGSYASNNSNNAILVFFIGAGPDNELPSYQQEIEKEAEKFGDLLQEDYVDSYQNLSLKSMSILKWVSSKCSNARFLLKADDDMYVNIPYLVTFLRSQVAPKSFIIGNVQTGAVPQRDMTSKWYTPISAFKDSRYPQYVSGTAYAMTLEAAEKLFQAALTVPLFWLEDIYITGLCAKKAGVVLINSYLFHYSKPLPSGCIFKSIISGHRYTNAQIQHIHSQLYDPNHKC